MPATRASARGKRKATSAPDSAAPPAKRLTNGKLSAGDNTPDVEIIELNGQLAFEDDLAKVEPFIGLPGSLGEWQDTIQKVVRNVVAIRFCQTCSFDTDPALTSEATGFVVDSERGYVLV